MNIYIDIETLPTTDAETIAEIAANIKPPANYSKPETIAASLGPCKSPRPTWRITH